MANTGEFVTSGLSPGNSKNGKSPSYTFAFRFVSEKLVLREYRNDTDPILILPVHLHFAVRGKKTVQG